MRDDEIKALEHQLKALELRKAGLSYQRIAESIFDKGKDGELRRVYKDGSGAWRAVKAALKKTLQEPSDELRQIEVARLDDMIFALWTSVRAGQQGAIDKALKVMERRAKLLGLDAPTRTDITSGDNRIEFIIQKSDINSVPPDPAEGE